MRRPRHKYFLAFLDWLTLNAAFILALEFAGQVLSAASLRTNILSLAEVVFFMAYAVLVVGIFEHNNLYKINVFLTVLDQITRIAISLFYAVLGLAFLSYFTKWRFVIDSRYVIFLFYTFSCVFLCFMRVAIFRSLFFLLAKTKVYSRKALIVGAGKTGKLLAANITVANPYGLRVIGFLDDNLPVGSRVVLNNKVLGSIDEGLHVSRKNHVSEILIALDDVSHDQLLEILDKFRKSRATVKIASPLYDVIPERIFTERYGEIPVTGVTNNNANEFHLLLKRAFDLILTTTGMLIFAPVYLAIALAVKLDSRGPVLYKQTRIGKDGQPFDFYKFRSMYVGSDSDSHRKTQVAKFIRGRDNGNGSMKIVDERQVTRVGKFIRKTSLDELPQLFNVLKGDMSLVGPRPCLPYEWENYENWHRKRLSVTPGCTGVWQVNGRSEVGFEDMVVLDLYYINNASILMDVKLILKTIPVMLFGRGGK